MAKGRRPFNVGVLGDLDTERIRAPIGIGAISWRYTVLVPFEETRPGQSPEPVATEEDIENLERMLTDHFNGLTIMPDSVGFGMREGQMELNKHTPFVIYAAATTPADLYFQALRKELEEALGQETILVERQEVWLH
jgi:hypothetical protein